MKRRLPLILLLACAIGFVLGIVQLFKLRFEAGDVYPPYSSLRSDPLGASALYESLGRLPGIKMTRDFRMTDELPDGKNTVYVQLAGRREDWEELPEQSFKEVQAFLNRGGRLVIALFPQTSKTLDTWASQRKASAKANPSQKSNPGTNPNQPPKKKKMIGEDTEFLKMVSLTEKWGFDFKFRELKPDDSGGYEPVSVKNTEDRSLPRSIKWHSGLVLTDLDDAWRVVYSRGDDAVLAERKFGTGSVVLSTDSYFLSNEALSNERHSTLLAWMIGPCRQIWFDEAHLGVLDNPGVASLMRNYHLHGLMLGLLLLAGLFIWKNAVSFAPRREDESAEDAVIGKDSAAGFVNLLRRHVRSGDVLNLCVAEWKKSLNPGKYSEARIQRVETLLQNQNSLAAHEQTPLATYRAICKTLKEKGASVSNSKPGTRNPEPGTNSPYE